MTASRTSGAGTQLASVLQENDLTVVPGVHDVLSALLAEQAGFPAVLVGSYASTACSWGLPDIGVVTVTEMIENGRRVIDALEIPVILDIDDAGGNPLRIRRNVELAARVGAAAVQIEDVDLARGKHFANQPHEVMSLERAVENIEAACAAREGSDMLVIARTDVLFTGSLEDAIERIDAFAVAGADIGFICLLPPAQIRLAVASASLPLLNTYIRDESRPEQIAEARADGLRIIVPSSLTFRAGFAAVQQALTELKNTERDPTLASWARVAADIDATVGIENWSKKLRPAPGA
ncbi:MAG: oxaloacetate decarboxylase [Acidimicrobiia bacterium]